MGTGNGNGNSDSRPPSPLDIVSERIEARNAEEARVLDPSITEPIPSIADDPMRAWQRTDGPVTLEQIHAGLVAVAQISEAAIEGGIRMSADLHRVIPVVNFLSSQVQTLAMRLDNITAVYDRVDRELASIHQVVTAARRDIQNLKDDVREVSDQARLVPAIKRMLADVLVRLPDEEPHKKPHGG